MSADGAPPAERDVVPGTQVIDRAVDILEAIGSHGPAVGVSELTRLLELKKPTVIRLLQALKNRGLVGQDPDTHRYRLGPNLIRLGTQAAGTSDYVRRAEPYLTRLSELTGETAHYCVMSDGRALIAAGSEGSKTLHLPKQIGKPTPLHCSSAGKVLICWLVPSALSSLIAEVGMTRYTERTVQDIGVLAAELIRVKATGYAVDDEEVEEGLYSIAVPVHDHTAHTIAALSVGGPASRLKPRAEEILAVLNEVAAAISEDFGYRVNA